MRIGINGSNVPGHDLEALLAHIESAESAGFSSYWLAQIGQVDALTVLAVAGSRTTSIELGTAIVPTWPRHPQALAAQSLTTQAATGGRHTLGIGLAHQPTVENRWKLEWQRPIRHIADYLSVIEPLLEHGQSAYTGEVWSYEGGDGVTVSDTPPSVVLAALGDQMLQIAGRRTDGTILWCVGPKTLQRQIVPKINDAAATANRPAPRTICSLPVWVTDRPDEARQLVADGLAAYGALPSYRAMFDIEGVDGPADIALIGSPSQVVDGVSAIAEAGATDFTAMVQGFDDDEQAHALELLTSC